MNTHDETRPPAPPDTGGLDMAFDVSSLYTLRSAVAAHASRLGLPEERLAKLLVVATELATNAIRHGAGAGTLRLWRENNIIMCAVSDDGPGITDPHLAGIQPAPLNENGRGLWLVRQFTDEVTITNQHGGVTVTVAVRL